MVHTKFAFLKWLSVGGEELFSSAPAGVHVTQFFFLQTLLLCSLLVHDKKATKVCGRGLWKKRVMEGARHKKGALWKVPFSFPLPLYSPPFPHIGGVNKLH